MNPPSSSSCPPRPRGRLAALALVALLGAPLPTQQFQYGDVYLYSTTLPLTPSQNYAGIVRVDPVTGATTPFLTIGHSVVGRIAYDPFRDRLLVSAGSALGTVAIDGAGNQTQVTPSFLDALAPRGDGIVYFYRIGVPTTYVPTIGLLDAGNQQHTLLDVGGTQPWTLSSSSVFGLAVRAIVYEASENALFLAMMGDNQAPSCSGSGSFDVTIRKLPLTSVGSALRSPATCTTFDVAGVAGATETPLQWSRGPNGDLVLAVQTSWSGAQPRLLRVVPSTLAVTPFATVGPYPGDQAMACGVYVPSIGEALVWDGGGKVFRTYQPGQAGAGTVLASYGNSVAMSDLLVVGGTGLFASLRADTYEVSTSAGGTQTMSFVPGPSHAGNLYLIVGSLSGWTPGLPLGSLVLPINYDAFTDVTIALAGSPLLPNTAGTVLPGGIMYAQVVVPPGILAPFAGLSLHFAGAVAQPGPSFTKVSNAIPLRLLP